MVKTRNYFERIAHFFESKRVNSKRITHVTLFKRATKAIRFLHSFAKSYESDLLNVALL